MQSLSREEDKAMSDSYIGWGPDVYNDAINQEGFPDMDDPVPDGNSAKGFGRSSTSNFSGTYYEPGGLHTGLSGQPVTPRYTEKGNIDK
jgi:hypothetical protein